MFVTNHNMIHRNFHNMSANWNATLDDGSWIVHLRRMLDEDFVDDDGVEVTIFNVPKPLLQSKPEAFVPQLIAIGPYHHLLPELYDMEKYKLSSVKRIQKKVPRLKFQDLVDRVVMHECLIRENYHKNLAFNSEMLGLLMAVDACFLLEFLQVYSEGQHGSGRSRSLRRISSSMSHLVDNTGRKSGHNTILKDVMMFENQIPLFLLRKVLDWEYPMAASDHSEQLLVKILSGFLQQLCPLKTIENFPAIHLPKHAHLLALLYYTLLPRCIETPEDVDANNDTTEIQELPSVEAPISKRDNGIGFAGETEHVTRLCHDVWGMVLESGFRLVKPLRFIVKIPWNLLPIIPGLSPLLRPLGFFFKGGNVKPEELIAGDKDKPPLVEEIMIPSVEELIGSGVKLCPTNGDLTSIKFESKTAKMYLPTIALDFNTEVILRNLVAYETSVVSGPLVFTRYTELMNGIIDTEEDVRLLRRHGILQNYMKSDKEVAEVWNGMSKSVRLTKVPFMDDMIRDVNKFHNSRWKVKAKKFMKKYVLGSWPFLTFLAAILLLLLTGLQAFCSVYACSRWVNLPVDDSTDQF